MGVQVRHHVGRLAGHARPAGQHQGPGARDPPGARRRVRSTPRSSSPRPAAATRSSHQVSHAAAPAAFKATPEARRPIFVNRGPELAALADALDAVRASARRLVLISGEHGCGKDRALRRVRAHGAGRRSRARVLRPVLRSRAAARALLPVSRRAHRARPPSPGPRAAHPRRSTRPSWLAQSSRSGSAPAAPRVHAVRMFDELGAALAALSSRPAARPRPRGSAVGRRRHRQRARAAGRESDSLEAAHRRHVLRRRVDGGPEGSGSPAGRGREGATRRSTLPLGSLTLEHVVRYIDARFGPECLSELAPAVHHATGGNPFMMVNAIDSLVARRLVVEDASGWRRDASLEAIARALAGDARRGHCAARRSPRPVGARSARSGRRRRSRVHGRRRWPPRSSRRSSMSAVCSGPLARRGHLIVAVWRRRSSPARCTAYRFRHALYADLIAQQAPMLRQLRVVERAEPRPRDRQTRPHAPSRVRFLPRPRRADGYFWNG